MATITAFESPHLVQRTWDQQRAAPERLTELSSVRVRTRCALEVGTSDDPINGHEAQPAGAGSGELAVSARAEMTVGELKQRISHLLHITPRKALSLTWWGVTLDDDERRLDTYHVNQNGQLQLSLSAKTQAELAAAHALSQVRVRSDDVSVVVGQLSPETTVAQVKNALLSGKVKPAGPASPPTSECSLGATQPAPRLTFFATALPAAAPGARLQICWPSRPAVLHRLPPELYFRIADGRQTQPGVVWSPA